MKKRETLRQGARRSQVEAAGAANDKRQQQTAEQWPIRSALARINHIMARMPYGGTVPSGMKMIDLGPDPTSTINQPTDFTQPDQLLKALAVLDKNLEGLRVVLEEAAQNDLQQSRELRDIHTALAGVGTLLKLALPDVVEQLEQAAAPSLAEANEAHRVRMAMPDQD